MNNTSTFERALNLTVGAITGKTPSSILHDNDIYRKLVSLSDFKRQVYQGYIHTPFQALLDEKLEQVTRYVASGGAEGIGRLIISIPPRHGKSLTVSKLYPAWFVGRYPDKRMIMASYGAALAGRNSRFVRNLISNPRYAELFPGIHLASDSASVQEWDIEGHDGGAIAAGVGGGITGHGAHLLIIDDPIKSRAEAESETYRQRLKDWYGDAYTRLEEPGGAIIIMHTRWHTDDLVGYLLRESADDWQVLNLPALAGENDAMGREPGAALWPERYGVEKLRQVKAEIGDYDFSALYQQSPIISQGGLFKREKFAIIDHEPANITRRVRFWDLALSSKTSADYTVGVLMGLTSDGHYVVLDVQRYQIEWDDAEPKLSEQMVKDSPRVSQGVESSFYQSRAVSKLLKRGELHAHSIRGITPDADKFTRALPFAARVGEGHVSLLRRAWTEAFIDELGSFPYGAHDDQVDGTSGAYHMLEYAKPIEATTRRYA